MKFVKVKSQKDGTIYYGMLIDNETDLKIFLNEKAADLTEAYQEAKGCNGNGHLSTLAMVVGSTVLKIENRQTFVDDVMAYCPTLLKPYIDSYNRYGGFYAWQNSDRWTKRFKFAGFTPMIEGVFEKMYSELLDLIEKNSTEFPNTPKYEKSDISIKRWEEGRHYYARVGTIDVEIDGVRKWNTYEYAYKMAEKFLDKL